MTDLSQRPPRALSLWKRIDKVWLTILAVPLVLALFDPDRVLPTIQIVGRAMGHTGVFILFAITLIAFVKATGAETLLAKAFQGDQRRMIILAAALGGLSPFCSCEVIPFIAALLAVGAPLSAVMAFWLASPLMDPAMFMITWGELGLDFAIGKTIAAIALGTSGGFLTFAFARNRLFADPLREKPQASGCCGAKRPFQGKPVWQFWSETDRRDTFRTTWMENALFLVKWLTLAYVAEALMLHYVPAEMIAQTLGGQGIGTIVLAALVGMPAYLNGYAAVGLLGGLLDQGMAPGAAMSFVIAGGVSCIPAAIAVWALVKPRIFAVYLFMGFAGAVLAGLAWAGVA